MITSGRQDSRSTDIALTTSPESVSSLANAGSCPSGCPSRASASAAHPIDHRADARAFEALLEKAKVRPTRLHDLRHTAATLPVAHGVPARIVMELLVTPRSP
ncbi:tyrosine-type recombinase/integrase [Cryptosporangium phraense]|uniref:Tyrosine-type recombinase/integrase n=1 Tax=Cryptosporangium phraense TaxID=2593070 RepID=A0A545APQ0_9ACTN|nr:tyrosine-type recombinase/integrase [Cryptosporangium phraense]